MIGLSNIRGVIFEHEKFLHAGEGNVLFDDLKLISKEHHINLFLDKEHSQDLRRLEEIYFNGVISQYTRSNGTKDYGINKVHNVT